MEILDLRPADWGWTALLPGFGLLADDFPDPWLRISAVDGDARVVHFGDAALPFEPFPGTIGVAPAEPGEHPVLVPTRWGGNLDVKHLRPGATLLLPVGVPGGLLSVGDTHAAMGDGEVCGTAVEAPMQIALRIGLRKAAQLPAPQFLVPAGELARVEAGGFHVCTGVAPDLMQASRDAVRAALELLARTRGMDPEEAYALVSVACDLRIHQLVDAPNWTVGCFVPQTLLGA